jgi:hypothetical protein
MNLHAQSVLNEQKQPPAIGGSPSVVGSKPLPVDD